MREEIVLLEKERWAGHILPMPSYTATEHYALSLRRTEDGFCAEFALRPLSSPLVFTPERYDHPDRLYAPHFEGAAAYGILHGEELIAVIELCPEEWNGRMRVTELWVKEDCRGRGLGKRLLTLVRRRRVVQGGGRSFWRRSRAIREPSLFIFGRGFCSSVSTPVPIPMKTSLAEKCALSWGSFFESTDFWQDNSSCRGIRQALCLPIFFLKTK